MVRKEYILLILGFMFLTACGQGFDSKSDSSAAGASANVDIFNNYADERHDSEMVVAIVQEKASVSSGSSSSGSAGALRLNTMKVASTRLAANFQDDPRYLAIKAAIDSCSAELALGTPTANQMTLRLIQPCAMDATIIMSFQAALSIDPGVGEEIDPSAFLPPEEMHLVSSVRILDPELAALLNYSESSSNMTIRLRWSQARILNAAETRQSIPFEVDAVGVLRMKDGRVRNLTVHYEGSVITDADALTWVLDVTGRITVDAQLFNIRARVVANLETGETVDATVTLNGVEIPYAELPDYLGLTSAPRSNASSASVP